MKSFISCFIKRLLPYSLAIFIFWPLISLICASFDQSKVSHIHIPIYYASIIGLSGVILLLKEFIIIGTFLFIISLLIFSISDFFNNLITLSSKISLVAEPFFLFISLFFLSSIIYPELISHKIIYPLSFFPVWAAYLLLFLYICILIILYAKKGYRLKLCFMIYLTSLLIVSLSESCWRTNRESSAKNINNIVLLGLDSISYADDLSILINWAKENGGIVYEKAVSPGLLTVSVWASLLKIEPVRKHGIFHAFQSGIEKNPKLLELSRAAGFRPISFFPDQFSCWLGSDVSYDEKFNGPIGWRQIAITMIENESVLIPIFRPILAKYFKFQTPDNHSGMYNYNLSYDLDYIFGSDRNDLFVNAHITFTHSIRYPKYTEISSHEIYAILKSKANLVVDGTLDWQYKHSADSPINLRKWKIRYLFENIITSLERTKFLKRGGKLIIFSDHGNRYGINEDNFYEPQYHHVILITFGFPKIKNEKQPISLLDIPSIIGFYDYKNFLPAVDYAISSPQEWPLLIKSSKIFWNGRVMLNQDILNKIFKRMKTFVPYENK